MAARATMESLIAQVRVFLSDAADANQTFSDDDIQNALDRHRRNVFAFPLCPEPTLVAGGTVEYRTYTVPISGWWEDDVILQDGTYAALAPTASDLIGGRWDFAANVNPPVYLTGKQYDLNGATADLLTAWQAKIKLDFDFLELGSTYKASQQVEMIAAVIAQYRSRQWIGTSTLLRVDDAAGWY